METEICDHPSCALTKLLLLIKMASEMGVDGMTEDEILEVGVRSLVALGISQEDIASATISLILGDLEPHHQR